jgi:hypothetical protein
MTIRVGYQKSGITPEDHRLFASCTMPATAVLTTASGLVTTGGALTNTGAMTATIGALRAIIQGASSSIQGPYPFVSDTAVGVTFTDGHATLPRQDLVVAQVRDTPYDGTGVQDGRIYVVTGTAAVSPVAPGVPISAIPLWEVRVPTGANAGNGGITWGSALTDRRVVLGLHERHYIAVSRTTTFNLAANTYVPVTWQAATGVSGTMTNPGTPTRLTVQRAGMWRVSGWMTWPNGATQCRIAVGVNSDSAQHYQLSYMVSSGGAQGGAGSIVLPLAVGDWITVQLYSLAGLTGVPAAYPGASMDWLGP